ncbi:MAG TPA: hypothetical protein DD723_03565 [Candidatus Omnitrophica bacterium]|nr:MAG: hypothetical protein A2Y04_01635 [Omnitrophica WOR_2 bacterium GWC2_45_7]HBR14609.1 hypothetical protein [Candidatus Omnitrophota bacterium]
MLFNGKFQRNRMKIKKIENILSIIGKVDEKKRFYLFIGVLVFVFLLDYLILMRPQLSTLMKINPEINILSQDIKQTQDDLLKISFYKSEVDRLRKNIKEVNQMIRSKDEVPLILERISRLANQNSIKIDQIMPNTQGQEILLDNKEQKYFKLPVLVEARGGFHNLGRFLNTIENDKMIVTIVDFDITKLNETNTLAVRLTLEAVIFEEI